MFSHCRPSDNAIYYSSLNSFKFELNARLLSFFFSQQRICFRSFFGSQNRILDWNSPFLAIGDLCFFISKNGELRCFYENNQDSFEHTTSQLFWSLTGLTSKRRADAALICVKTAIKRYENSSSQCVFRTDSASEKSCGFLSFRLKNTKLFRPKAENGIFRHLCGKKRNKSGGGKTFSEFLGIKPSQCLWPSFQMVLTGIGNCAYRTLSKSFGKHICLPWKASGPLL